jgi:predicted XRE-type DNA-binding protein
MYICKKKVMLQISIFQFLNQLKEHNNREWFAENKKAFLAEEKLAKVKLASVIADILEQQQITHQEAGEVLDLEVEKVNNLINGILKEFTIENLLSYLIKLGQNVEY